MIATTDLRIGDRVTVLAAELGLARSDYGARPIARITAIGTRGGLTAELAATGRTIALTAADIDLERTARNLELAPYNVTIGDAGAIGPVELGAQVAARALYGRRVIILGGSAYAELLEAAGIHQLERPLDGCAGLGYMRGRLAAIARTGELDDKTRLLELGPMGRHAEQLALFAA